MREKTHSLLFSMEDPILMTSETEEKATQIEEHFVRDKDKKIKQHVAARAVIHYSFLVHLQSVV
jgi:hypothetical protein